jgi:hypothetical protein
MLMHGRHDTTEDTMAVSEDIRIEIEVPDVDTDDTDEIEFAVSTVEECAAAARAEVNMDMLSAEDGAVVIEITGYFAEVSAFMRRWESEL